MESYVLRPITIECPVVIRRNRRRSAERCHGKPPPQPITRFSAMATMREIFIKRANFEDEPSVRRED